MATYSYNPEIKKLNEYAAFDVLRFILASCVFLTHMNVLAWHQAGNLAVQVFFALSGWLIGAILCNTPKGELSRFYYNRSTRVWAPYFFSVFAIYITSYVHESMHSTRWLEFLAYDVTFTHNWFTLRPDPQIALKEMPLAGTGNHFWSLAVEEQFYLVAPLIITLLPFGKRIVPWICIAALAIMSGSQYGAISLGVLSSIVFRKFGPWHLTALGSLGIIILLAMAIAAIVAISNVYVYVAPFIAICIVLLCARPIRRTTTTKWLGGVSFPLYLNAWIGTFILHAINKHFSIMPSWFSQPLEFLSGLAGASLTYLLIDKAVMETRDRYFKHVIGLMLGGLAYTLVLIGVIFGLSAM